MTDTDSSAAVDISRIRFRFPSKRDRLPTHYLHVALNVDQQHDDLSLRLTTDVVFDMLSSYGKLIATHIFASGTRAYVQFDTAPAAARALNALRTETTSETKSKVTVNFALPRTQQSMSNAPTSHTHILDQHTRFYQRTINDEMAAALSALNPHLAMPTPFGAAIADEDGLTGLPKPKPLNDVLSRLITNIQETISQPQHNSHHIEEEKKNASSQLYLPQENPISLTSASTPLFNRVTFIQLHPGAPLPPAHLDTDVYSPYSVLIPLQSHAMIDLYDHDSNSKPQASVLLSPQSLFVMNDTVARTWRWGIPGRTRDRFDNTVLKRSTLTLIHLTNVVNNVKLPQNHLVAQRERADRVHTAIPLSSADLSRLDESEHVRQVYNRIATHFSHTRHSPWPRVEAFVNAIPSSSLVADVGCGNGKYMGLHRGVMMIGIDISSRLCLICRQRGYEVNEGDCTALPYKSNTYDAVIAIALLHHLSTEERRVIALCEMCRIVVSGGRILVCAWALEQDQLSRRRFESQDVLVPWNVQARHIQHESDDNTYQHLHNDDGTSKVDAIDDRDSDDTQSVCVHRYCHVYVQGELEELVGLVNKRMMVENNGRGVSVRDSYYDRGNWCVVIQKD
ncbi:unnamed protein product [Sphagnum balticum]